MPFKDEDNSLRDIVDAIGMIESFTSGMDFEAFHEDPKTIAAVERKPQIISEAAIRLGANAETRMPGLPWRDIRGIGNWLRHQYERIDLATIWKTVQADLPALKAAPWRNQSALVESSPTLAALTRHKPRLLRDSLHVTPAEWMVLVKLISTRQAKGALGGVSRPAERLNRE